jgi:hypothetical protein
MAKCKISRLGLPSGAEVMMTIIRGQIWMEVKVVFVDQMPLCALV